MHITILTAVLNSAEELKKTLNKLQKIDDYFKHIIIDGGSIDSTLSILERYENKYTLISEQDSGISDAFNKGIRLAESDYILILNAGDLIDNDTFQYYYQEINKSPDVDVFYGNLKYFSDNTNSYVEKPNINNIWKFMSIYHPGMLVKKTAYEKIGGYNLDYKYAMDSEWVHRAIKNGLKFHYIPHVLASMALGGKSDKYFYFSLIEFCRSSMKYGPGKLLPLYYLVRQLAVHSLLKIHIVKKWRLKNKYLNE